MGALAAGADSSAAGTAFLITGAVLLYFVPLIIGAVRRVRWFLPLAAVNVLTGWTGIGWIAALVMAVWPKGRVSRSAAG
jgi:hypothetical protein